jgi:hypothetical protein
VEKLDVQVTEWRDVGGHLLTEGHLGRGGLELCLEKERGDEMEKLVCYLLEGGAVRREVSCAELLRESTLPGVWRGRYSG